MCHVAHYFECFLPQLFFFYTAEPVAQARGLFAVFAEMIFESGPIHTSMIFHHLVRKISSHMLGSEIGAKSIRRVDQENRVATGNG